MTIRIITALCLMFSAATALANPAAAEAPAMEKPSISTTQMIMLNATVVAIDHETRMVTLEGPLGEQRTLEVAEQAHRLGEVAVGDVLMVEIAQQMTIDVVAVEGAEPAHGAIAAVATAPESERPGIAATATEIVTALVHEINLEDNTFKLDWGEDGIAEYVARDPENLKLAEVGDMVIVTYTEAMAVQLQDVPSEE